MTPSRLDKVALSYVDRYGGTAESLRRVLARRIARYGTPDDREMLEAAAEATVERLVKAGIVDDRAFAESRARGLARRNTAPLAIRARLRAKGVDDADMAHAIDAAGIDDEYEIEAARAYARRRRIGPYAPPDRAPDFPRDAGRLARAGFSSAAIRKVMEGGAEE